MKIFLLLMLTLSLWANMGNIMAMKGSADVKRGTTTLSATNGMELERGDTLITASKSRLQIMLQDETVITIGANSEFSFEEYLYDESKNSKLTMRAKRGFFRSVTGRIGKVAPERFKVKTASATIGIRGTDFSGDISEHSELFKCYQGEIYIEFEGNTRTLDAGMMAEIFKGKIDIKERVDAIRLKSIDSQMISPELISEITQIAEDEDNQAEDDTLDEPNSNPEDRQEQY